MYELFIKILVTDLTNIIVDETEDGYDLIFHFIEL